MTWPEFLKANYSAATVERYGRDAKRYLAWVGGEAAALTADYTTIVTYVTHLRSQYQRAITVGYILASVKAYHRYLLESGQRWDHPAASLVLRDGGRRRGQMQLQELLGTEELQRLLSAPTILYDRLAARGVPIVGLLVHQALRSDEIARLRVEDLDLPAGTIRIAPGGRSAARRLSLAGDQVMTLHRYVTEERPKKILEDRPAEQLFLTLRGGPEQVQGVDKIVRKLRPLVPGKRLTPRLIRQSVIAGKLRQGEDVRQVQAFAGLKWVIVGRGLPGE